MKRLIEIFVSILLHLCLTILKSCGWYKTCRNPHWKIKGKTMNRTLWQPLDDGDGNGESMMKNTFDSKKWEKWNSIQWWEKWQTNGVHVLKQQQKRKGKASENVTALTNTWTFVCALCTVIKDDGKKASNRINEENTVSCCSSLFGLLVFGGPQHAHHSSD